MVLEYLILEIYLDLKVKFQVQDDLYVCMYMIPVNLRHQEGELLDYGHKAVRQFVHAVIAHNIYRGIKVNTLLNQFGYRVTAMFIC